MNNTSMSNKTLCDCLAVIGVGLIGGSFALSLKNRGLVNKVIGVGRSEENLLLAKQRNIIDEYTISISEAVKQADVIFISVPVNNYKNVFKQIKGQSFSLLEQRLPSMPRAMQHSVGHIITHDWFEDYAEVIVDSGNLPPLTYSVKLKALI